MILDLHIENFAIIDHLELSFGSGLVVFTGETGAGKSIIIDAVETLLGGRTEAHMVRASSERAIIEGSFAVPAAYKQAIRELLEKEELLDDPACASISLGREIRLAGRSVARINGRSVSISLLKQVGEFLVDVHGQSEHLSLLRVNQHLGLLDSYAGSLSSKHTAQQSAYQKIYRRLQSLRRELVELRQAESEAARRTDMLNFQIKEIDSARLKPGEEESLRDERNRLANAEGLASAAQEAIQALEEGTPEAPAAADLVGQAAHAISALARLDPSQTALEEQAQAVVESLAEIGSSLRDYLETIEYNPRRLDQVEERLNLVNTLKRKYARGSAGSIQDVLNFVEDARQQLETVAHAGERIEALSAEEETLLTQLAKAGETLSQSRRQAAQKLEQQLENELEHLSMSGARFKVEFNQRSDPNGAPLADGSRRAFDANGLEQVEFLVAPNPGEGLKPLVKVASGGETSRLMLAIKNVLARADQVPTLIFDEIDQGIGGRVGAVVGRKLWDLGRQHQVLCVTHLPQLAAFGEQHLQVQKAVHNGRTSTQVQLLSGEERVQELALMMGEINNGTLESARELIQNVERSRKVP